MSTSPSASIAAGPSTGSAGNQSARAAGAAASRSRAVIKGVRRRIRCSPTGGGGESYGPARTGPLSDHYALGGGVGPEGLGFGGLAWFVPAQLRAHGGGDAGGRVAREQRPRSRETEPRAPQQRVPHGACLLAPRRVHRFGEEVGVALDHRRGQLRPLGRD